MDMDDFIDVLAADDLPDGGLTAVDVDGHELLVARVGEQVYIADNRCPHLGGRLSKGELNGTVITCHLHHSQFDLTDGSVIRWTDWKGAVLSIAELARHPRPLRTYAVKVEDGRVLVGPERVPSIEPLEGV
jgi:3-phenylpropionate/trans-cinnamate dioxygenase ferredoxin subunit